MNSNVIYKGPQETVTNASAVAIADPVGLGILVVKAETDLVITDLVYMFPIASSPNAQVDTLTLKQGGFLFYVKSLTFSGTATLTYGA